MIESEDSLRDKMVNKYARQDKRDRNHEEIVSALNKYGFMVWNIQRPVDLLCADRSFFCVEIKYEKGVKRPVQIDFETSCRAMNLPYYVVRTVKDVEGIYHERHTDIEIDSVL